MQTSNQTTTVLVTHDMHDNHSKPHFYLVQHKTTTLAIDLVKWIDDDADWLYAAINIGLIVTKNPAEYNDKKLLSYGEGCVCPETKDEWIAKQAQLIHSGGIDLLGTWTDLGETPNQHLTALPYHLVTNEHTNQFELSNARLSFIRCYNL